MTALMDLPPPPPPPPPRSVLGGVVEQAEAALAEAIDAALWSVADAELVELVVAAGNVLVYVDPGTEAAVLHALASVLSPGGSAVFGFATDRAYTVADLDRDAAAVGWHLVHRFSTWQ